MSTIGTFDGFTAARLGIYAAQQGLSVTGNNISNINTTGYTRQVLDQISLKTGAYDRYRSQFDNHIGTGTLVRSIIWMCASGRPALTWGILMLCSVAWIKLLPFWTR